MPFTKGGNTLGDTTTMNTTKSRQFETAKAFAVLIPAGLGMIELFGWAHASGGAFQAGILSAWPEAPTAFKNPFLGIYLLLPMLLTAHASRLFGEWVLFRLPVLGDRSFQDTYRPWIIAGVFSGMCGLLYKIIILIMAGQFLDPELSADYLMAFFGLSSFLRLFLLNLPNNFEFPTSNGAYAILGKNDRAVYCITNYLVIEWDVMDGEVTLLVSKSDFPSLSLKAGNDLTVQRVNRYFKRRNTIAMAFKVGEVASSLSVDSFGDGLLKLKSVHAQVSISKTLTDLDLTALPVASLRDSTSSALAGTKVEQFLDGILKRGLLDAVAEVEAGEACKNYEDAMLLSLSENGDSHPLELIKNLRAVTEASRQLQVQSTRLARELSKRKQTHGGLFVISFTPAGIIPNPDCTLSEPAYARLMSSIQIGLSRDQFDQELRLKLLDALQLLAKSEIYPTNCKGTIDSIIQDVKDRMPAAKKIADASSISVAEKAGLGGVAALKSEGMKTLSEGSNMAPIVTSSEAEKAPQAH